MLSVTLADGFAAWREHAFLARSVRVFTQQVQAKRDKETLVLTMLVRLFSLLCLCVSLEQKPYLSLLT